MERKTAVVTSNKRLVWDNDDQRATHELTPPELPDPRNSWLELLLLDGINRTNRFFQQNLLNNDHNSHHHSQFGSLLTGRPSLVHGSDQSQTYPQAFLFHWAPANQSVSFPKMSDRIPKFHPPLWIGTGTQTRFPS